MHAKCSAHQSVYNYQGYLYWGSWVKWNMGFSVEMVTDCICLCVCFCVCVWLSDRPDCKLQTLLYGRIVPQLAAITILPCVQVLAWRARATDHWIEQHTHAHTLSLNPHTVSLNWKKPSVSTLGAEMHPVSFYHKWTASNWRWAFWQILPVSEWVCHSEC